MARPFSSKEAKFKITGINSFLSEMEDKRHAPEHYRDKINTAANDLRTEEAIKILTEIPIEEINRHKKGFRVKALRNAGIKSMADTLRYSAYTLAAIRGIGQDSAFQIKRISNDLANKAMANATIRLSLDDRSQKATALVKAIARYDLVIPHAQTCSDFVFHYKNSINNASIDLKCATGGIKWFFASKSKKEKAIKAFGYLDDFVKSDNYREAKDALAKIKSIDNINQPDAWDYFAKNPVRVLNILQTVCPEAVGQDDRFYGLPKNLANEIQDEAFFPDGLTCDLYPYQEVGVKYILHQGKVLLGDEMGLGKTIQAIATMVSLKNTGATHFMVICPASVLSNWCREIQKRSKLRAIAVYGPDKISSYNQWFENGGVAVTTYETIGQLLIYDGLHFDLLVVDEAHYIKNPKAARSKNTTFLCGLATRILFMTGTALENRVEEMINLISVLRPDIAQTLVGIEALASAPEFRKKIVPVYYRRKREEVMNELPEKTEVKEWCTLGNIERSKYERSARERRYMDMRRVSWDVDDLNLSSKASRLKEIIEEAQSEGRKILVFSFFRETLFAVCSCLGNRCLGPINGSVSPARRQEIIDEFTNASAGTVLVAQIQAGGTGLNIQAASVVVICEPQFKPSIENQAISRAYRMGQSRNVLVYRLLSENTIDERITQWLEEKQRTFDAFADVSNAAQLDQKMLQEKEIDNRTFGALIEEEIKAINARNNIENT